MPEIIDVLHIFSSIMKGLIIRQADVRVSARVVTARPVIMPRVSRRGLNFDLNACQYGVYNSVPTISYQPLKICCFLLNLGLIHQQNAYIRITTQLHSLGPSDLAL